MKYVLSCLFLLPINAYPIDKDRCLTCEEYINVKKTYCPIHILRYSADDALQRFRNTGALQDWENACGFYAEAVDSYDDVYACNQLAQLLWDKKDEAQDRINKKKAIALWQHIVTQKICPDAYVKNFLVAILSQSSAAELSASMPLCAEILDALFERNIGMVAAFFAATCVLKGMPIKDVFAQTLAYPGFYKRYISSKKRQMMLYQARLVDEIVTLLYSLEINVRTALIHYIFDRFPGISSFETELVPMNFWDDYITGMGDIINIKKQT